MILSICPKCGHKALEQISGSLELDDVFGKIHIPIAVYYRCGHCHVELYPAKTSAAIQEERHKNIQKNISGGKKN
jgi:predicted nucleic-acid-binding Zn-ribbon protein